MNWTRWNDADTALARLQRDPTDLTRLRATLPTKLVVAIHKLLARNPAQRPATGAELVATLRDAAKEGPPPIDPTPYEQSPVTPFGGKRLRRAPSDVAGRAEDRARAVRPTGPIPGEVAHVQGSPTPTASTRDQTPSAIAPRGKPAKGLTQEWRPAFTVVALLLVAGLVVGVLVWSSMSFGGGDPVELREFLADHPVIRENPRQFPANVVLDCEIDLVPGGIFRTVMRSPEGQEYPNLGCWLEVVPNERLVWTNVFEPGYRPTRHASGADCDEFPFTAVVAMAPHGSGTWYTARVIHGTEDARRRHADMGFHDGWGAALDQMVAMIRHGSAARTNSASWATASA